MSEQKRELSKLCLTGFLLSILFPVLFIFLNSSASGMLGDVFSWILTVIVLLCPLAGFVLSIAGVATARKGNKSGKGFGIVGIILPCVYAVIALIIGLFVGLVISAFTMHKTDKKIPTFYSDSEIVSVRYYYMGADGYRVEDLDEDRLDDFVDDLDSMEIQTGGMLNYYWGGRFGIEMELEDGTYMTYDGTKLELLGRSRLDDDFSSDDVLRGKSRNVYVMNYEFWDVMKDYFPSIEENGDDVFSRS